MCDRISYFFGQARYCLRMARWYGAAYRRDLVRLALRWRDLAKQTRRRKRGIDLSERKY